MAGVIVDPAAVAADGARVAGAAADSSAAGVGPIGPAAADPVSVAAAETLSVRLAALVAYRAAGHETIRIQAGMLAASGAAYGEQEGANQAGLILGGSAPASVAAPPTPPALAPLPPAQAPAVMVGPPPADGKTLATLIHAGDPDGLFAAARWSRQQAGELDDTADQLWSGAARVEADLQSPAGDAAASGLRKTAIWCYGHAGHFRSAAAAFDTAADNFGRAKAATPSPRQFEDVEQQLARVKAVVAADPRLAVLYGPLIPHCRPS